LPETRRGESEGCFDRLSIAPHPGSGYDRRVDLSLSYGSSAEVLREGYGDESFSGV